MRLRKHGGLNGLEASPVVHDILTGAILLTVALSDDAHTPRRFGWPYRKLKTGNIDDAGGACVS
jgi:hypothetical protein